MIEERFLRLAENLKVHDPEFHWKVLKGFYSEPFREYHTLEHVEAVLHELDKHRYSLDWREPVEWAIFWHDSFYSTRLTDDNESLSANMALAALSSKSEEFNKRVQALILATKHDKEPTFKDAQFMCDFDLAVLGGTPEDYDDYRNKIRREYGWVPLDTYNAERAKILQALLDRGQIYYSRYYRKILEPRAEKNVKRELAAITGDPQSIPEGSAKMPTDSQPKE